MRNFSKEHNYMRGLMLFKDSGKIQENAFGALWLRCFILLETDTNVFMNMDEEGDKEVC